MTKVLKYDALVALLLVLSSGVICYHLGAFLGVFGLIVSPFIGFAIGWYGMRHWLESGERDDLVYKAYKNSLN